MYCVLLFTDFKKRGVSHLVVFFFMFVNSVVRYLLTDLVKSFIILRDILSDWIQNYRTDLNLIKIGSVVSYLKLVLLITCVKNYFYY